MMWLTEVAPRLGSGERFWEHVKGANEQAHAELIRLAMRITIGSGKTTVMAMLMDGSLTFHLWFLPDPPGLSPIFRCLDA